MRDARQAEPTRDRLDKAVLILAFFAGTGGVVALKHFGAGPVAAAGAAIAVLLAYVVATSLTGRAQLEPESIGDNAYYLGFLFTLTSLAYTLWQISGNTDQTSALREIISGFGVALLSTIMGVFLRVFMMQMRPDIVARDREARAELHMAAREFRTQLSSSIATIKTYTEEANQLASEQAHKVARLTDELMESNRVRMQADVEIYAEKLGEAFEKASAKIVTDVGKTIETSARASRSDVSRALTGLASDISSFAKSQADAMASSTEREVEAAEASLRAAKATRAAADGIETFSKSVIGASAAIAADIEAGGQTLGRARADIAEAISSSVAVIEAAARRTSAALEPGPRLRPIAPAIEALASVAASLQALAGRIDHEMNRLAEVTAVTRQSTAGVPGTSSENATGAGASVPAPRGTVESIPPRSGFFGRGARS